MFMFSNVGEDNSSLACGSWNDGGSACAIDGVVMGEALSLMVT
jgi:hypothetical protein